MTARESLAHHEAAHAIIGLALGFAVESVTIISTAHGRGHAVLVDSPAWSALARAKRRMLSTMAGPIAEVMRERGQVALLNQAATSLTMSFDKREEDWRVVGLAAEFISRHVGQPARIIMDRGATHALMLIGHPLLWPCIQATAQALLARDTLSGHEVGQIARGCFPSKAGKIPRFNVELAGDVPLKLRWVIGQ